MHNAVAPKKCGGTNSSTATHTKTLLHNAAACRAMLRHIAPCRGISYNAVAQKTAPRHEAQHRGTQKNQHARDIANAMAQKKCHGTTTAQKAAHGAMPQQIMEGRGTKHNAAALITLPRHKAHCRGTKSCCGTQKSLRHKKCAAAQSETPRHIKQSCGTKIVPHNAKDECARPRQKNLKPKTPPTTMTAQAAAQVDCFFHYFKKPKKDTICKKHNNQKGHNNCHYATVMANAAQVDCFLPPPILTVAL